MNSNGVLDILEQKYPAPAYAFFRELRGGTGWVCEQRADAIVMSLYPSKGLDLTGFEVKTSRGDWLTEMKKPDKANFAKQFCDRWYLLVSDLKIIKYADELPSDWGLMFIEDGQVRTMIEAPKLEPIPISRLFLASIVRRVHKCELLPNKTEEGESE